VGQRLDASGEHSTSAGMAKYGAGRRPRADAAAADPSKPGRRATIGFTGSRPRNTTRLEQMAREFVAPAATL